MIPSFLTFLTSFSKSKKKFYLCNFSNIVQNLMNDTSEFKLTFPLHDTKRILSYHTLNSDKYSKSFKGKTFFLILKNTSKTSKMRVSNYNDFVIKKVIRLMLFSFVYALKLINIPLWVVNKMSKDQKIFPNLKKTQTNRCLQQSSTSADHSSISRNDIQIPKMFECKWKCFSQWIKSFKNKKQLSFSYISFKKETSPFNN